MKDPRKLLVVASIALFITLATGLVPGIKMPSGTPGTLRLGSLATVLAQRGWYDYKVPECTSKYGCAELQDVSSNTCAVSYDHIHNGGFPLNHVAWQGAADGCDANRGFLLILPTVLVDFAFWFAIVFVLERGLSKRNGVRTNNRAYATVSQGVKPAGTVARRRVNDSHYKAVLFVFSGQITGLMLGLSLGALSSVIIENKLPSQQVYGGSSYGVLLLLISVFSILFLLLITLGRRMVTSRTERDAKNILYLVIIPAAIAVGVGVKDVLNATQMDTFTASRSSGSPLDVSLTSVLSLLVYFVATIMAITYFVKSRNAQ